MARSTPTFAEPLTSLIISKEEEVWLAASYDATPGGLPRSAAKKQVMMPWIAAAAHTQLLAALNSDILKEFSAADRYLHAVRFPDAAMCRQAAHCAAAALATATALAAEVMALGGAPPEPLHVRPAEPRAPITPDEHLLEARAEIAHYQGRAALARRLGLLRLQQVFRDIVGAKREQAARAAALAAARTH